jgi:hypothetical protein
MPTHPVDHMADEVEQFATRRMQTEERKRAREREREKESKREREKERKRERQEHSSKLQTIKVNQKLNNKKPIN